MAKLKETNDALT